MVEEPWWKGPYKHWKSIAAFVVAFLAQVVVEPELNWRVFVVAGITSAAVWGIPNPLRNGSNASTPRL